MSDLSNNTMAMLELLVDNRLFQYKNLSGRCAFGNADGELVDQGAVTRLIAHGYVGMIGDWDRIQSRRVCDYCGPVAYIPHLGVCEDCRETRKVAA